MLLLSLRIFPVSCSIFYRSERLRLATELYLLHTRFLAEAGTLLDWRSATPGGNTITSCVPSRVELGYVSLMSCDRSVAIFKMVWGGGKESGKKSASNFV